MESTPESVEYLFTNFEVLKVTASESREGVFEPAVNLKTVLPKGDKSGALYGCFLTGSLELESPFCIHGIRLEDTLEYLRTANSCTDPNQQRDAELLAKWPNELRLMRGFVEDADINLVELLQRSAPLIQDYSTPDLSVPRDQARVMVEQHLKAHIEALTKHGRRGAGDPAKSRFIQADHFVLFCGHTGEGWRGPQSMTYFQFFLFDDLWANANSVLANSLLHYSKHWDPFYGKPKLPLSDVK